MSIHRQPEGGASQSRKILPADRLQTRHYLLIGSAVIETNSLFDHW
jgi:hypothetical protein